MPDDPDSESDQARPPEPRVPNPQGLLTALELMETGRELARQRLIRLNPLASSEEIDTKLAEWVLTPRSKTVRSPD